jgi:hypothetical protein
MSVPIQYHIEVYEGSFENDPTFSWEATTPFPAIVVGDFFERSTIEGWISPPKSGQRFRVREVEHIFWKINSSHIGHKLMVCLQLVGAT